MGSDFPSNNRGNYDAGEVALAILGLILIAVVLLGAYLFVHGLWTKDVWETVYGGVILAIWFAIQRAGK